MKAIEINSKTDKFGNLKIDYLNKKDSKVRILILMDDDYLNPDDEKSGCSHFQKILHLIF